MQISLEKRLVFPSALTLYSFVFQQTNFQIGHVWKLALQLSLWGLFIPLRISVSF